MTQVTATPPPYWMGKRFPRRENPPREGQSKKGNSAQGTPPFKDHLADALKDGESLSAEQARVKARHIKDVLAGQGSGIVPSAHGAELLKLLR